MASTFKRKAKSTSSPLPTSTTHRGTKPWTGGIHLTSTGLREFDTLLGGGQPLGTAIFLEEDRWTRCFTDSFVRYWLAEGHSHEHHLLISSRNKHEVERLMSSLPRNLTLLRRNVPTDEMAKLDILEETEENEDELEIAWQYKKEVQQERLGQSNISKASRSTTQGDFCYSYDLNTSEEVPLYPQNVHLATHETIQDLIGKIKELQTTRNALIRILFHHADALSLSRTLPLLLAWVRSKGLPVVIMVTLKPWEESNPRPMMTLKRVCDVVLSTEGFASRREYPPPAEFRHLHGLLHVLKVTTVTAATAIGGGHFADLTTGKRADPTTLYGLKRDRRKLNIVLLHIPPEDHTDGGGQGSGGVRSGGGRPPKAQPSLDF